MNRTPRAFLALAAVLAIGAGTGLVTPASGGYGTPPGGFGTAGPPYRFKTELMAHDVELLVNQSALERTGLGYRYRSGSQNNRLTVTLTSDGLLQFVDPATTNGFKHLASECVELSVDRGLAATCPVPDDLTTEKPLLIEVWPRNGNDTLDTTTLPAEFAVAFLADLGNDTARFGAGPDFFNGHLGTDRAFGGDGNDWLRPGGDDDLARGGLGNDQIVTIDGDDRIYGDVGDDLLYGGNGADQLFGGAGTDRVNCGNGQDQAEIDDQDTSYQTCEATTHVGDLN